MLKQQASGARCFTTYSSILRNQLMNQVGVLPAYNPDGTDNNRFPANSEINALWDTGAQSTCISEQLAERLALPIIGMQQVSSPTGISNRCVHMVNIFLPNNVRVEKASVINAAINGFDVLIGMDIIGLGDFIVSNYDGKTVFTFRYPSLHGYDFTKSNYLTVERREAVGRNMACPCGSGKKYKHCCGKTA